MNEKLDDVKKMFINKVELRATWPISPLPSGILFPAVTTRRWALIDCHISEKGLKADYDAPATQERSGARVDGSTVKSFLSNLPFRSRSSSHEGILTSKASSLMKASCLDQFNLDYFFCSTCFILFFCFF